MQAKELYRVLGNVLVLLVLALTSAAGFWMLGNVFSSHKELGVAHVCWFAALMMCGAGIIGIFAYAYNAYLSSIDE